MCINVAETMKIQEKNELDKKLRMIVIFNYFLTCVGWRWVYIYVCKRDVLILS